MVKVGNFPIMHCVGPQTIPSILLLLFEKLLLEILLALDLVASINKTLREPWYLNFQE